MKKTITSDSKEAIDSKLDHLLGNAPNSNVKWSNLTESQAKFELINQNLDKSVSGMLRFKDGALVAAIKSTNYISSRYISKKINNELLELGFHHQEFSVEYDVPEIGSVITTKEFIDDLREGDEVELLGNMYYFSKDDDDVDCNGWLLRQNWMAVFIEYIERGCDGSTNYPSTYSVFEIVDAIT